MASATAFRLREPHTPDCARLAELSGQLGYPAAPAEIEQRLAALPRDGNHKVLVAERADGFVAGWVHCYVVLTLESEPRAEIGGIVVDESCRGAGVGALLLTAAEEWAHGKGLPLVALRSNILRTGAHTFYERHGYECIKTQHAYRKRFG